MLWYQGFENHSVFHSLCLGSPLFRETVSCSVQGFPSIHVNFSYFVLYTMRSSKRPIVSNIHLCKFHGFFSFQSFGVSPWSTTVKRINTQSIFVKNCKNSVHYTGNDTQAKHRWKCSHDMVNGGSHSVLVLSRNNVIKRNIISETDSGVCDEPSVKRINKCPFFPNNLHSSTQRKENCHYSKCQHGAFYLDVSHILSFKDFSLETSY